MKKVAVILIICIYALSTFGVNLKEFYCCGTLQDVSFSLPGSENMKVDNRAEKSGCCKTKLQFYKVKDNHFTTHQDNGQVNPVDNQSSFLPFSNIFLIAISSIELANSAHAPPLFASVPVYISNCVFLI